MKLILLFFSFFFNILIAQTKSYQYDYDNSGNRISRNVLYLMVAGNNDGNTTANNASENAFSDGSGDSAGYSISTEIENGRINLFPNPATSTVNIEFDKEDTQTKEARILNFKGQIV